MQQAAGDSRLGRADDGEAEAGPDRFGRPGIPHVSAGDVAERAQNRDASGEATPRTQCGRWSPI
jgi:hypothetical protein